MKFDISSILKTDGAQLPIEINQLMEGLNTILDDLSFESPVMFKGSILNNGGVIKLKGKLSTLYKSKCSRCLNEVETEISTDIIEDFLKREKVKKKLIHIKVSMLSLKRSLKII